MGTDVNSTRAVTRASTRGVLQSMPRRAWLAQIDQAGPILRVREPISPKVSILRVLLRALQWMVAFSLYSLRRSIDKAKGDKSLQKRGERLRKVFEGMGGTGIKVGQQMAVRVDFLPFEVCAELGKLMDSVPPFETDVAVARIEAAAGKPLDEILSKFVREPIGSASMACVYRGTLHSGEEVAIKVRRPDVDRQFAADIQFIEGATKLMEWLTLVRPEFFKHLRTELKDMLFDELDFVKEANYQSMFRRYVKRDRFRWLSAPKVVAALSNADVLTSEFIDGYSCTDVLRAIETQDSEALATLASVGIDPAVVGRRVMQIGLWGRLECAFFHSDPHPGNILIRPGNKIVMLDFGACGIMSRKQAEHQRETSRRLLKNDIAGAAAVSVSMMAPLPNLDVPLLRQRIEHAIWEYHISMKTKQAQWWERTTAAIWVTMIEATKEFQLPVNLDILRMTRATLLYDTLACRLNPKINAENAFRRWLPAAAKRERRRAKRRRRLAGQSGVAAVVHQVGNLAETLQKGAFWASHATRELPKEFMAMQHKGAFVAGTLLRFALSSLFVFVLAITALLVRAWVGGVAPAYLTLLWSAVTHPVVMAIFGGLLVLVIIRIQVRLRDKDLDR